MAAKTNSDVIYLPPSIIRYSQFSIQDSFQDGGKIGDLLDDIVFGRCFVSGLKPIEVSLVDGEWYSADNRRLWVMKNLEVLGRVDTIQVKVRKKIFQGKMTTKNQGESIKIRGGDPGGSIYPAIQAALALAEEQDENAPPTKKRKRRRKRAKKNKKKTADDKCKTDESTVAVNRPKSADVQAKKGIATGANSNKVVTHSKTVETQPKKNNTTCAKAKKAVVNHPKTVGARSKKGLATCVKARKEAINHTKPTGAQARKTLVNCENANAATIDKIDKTLCKAAVPSSRKTALSSSQHSRQDITALHTGGNTVIAPIGDTSDLDYESSDESEHSNETAGSYGSEVSEVDFSYESTYDSSDDEEEVVEVLAEYSDNDFAEDADTYKDRIEERFESDSLTNGDSEIKRSASNANKPIWPTTDGSLPSVQEVKDFIYAHFEHKRTLLESEKQNIEQKMEEKQTQIQLLQQQLTQKQQQQQPSQRKPISSEIANPQSQSRRTPRGSRYDDRDPFERIWDDYDYHTYIEQDHRQTCYDRVNNTKPPQTSHHEATRKPRDVVEPLPRRVSTSSENGYETLPRKISLVSGYGASRRIEPQWNTPTRINGHEASQDRMETRMAGDAPNRSGSIRKALHAREDEWRPSTGSLVKPRRARETLESRRRENVYRSILLPYEDDSKTFPTPSYIYEIMDRTRDDRTLDTYDVCQKCNCISGKHHRCQVMPGEDETMSHFGVIFPAESKAAEEESLLGKVFSKVVGFFASVFD